jgi:hypothetical protein
MQVGGQRNAPATLPPGNTRYPLNRRLGGPQGRSGRGAEDVARVYVQSENARVKFSRQVDDVKSAGS